MVTIETIQSFNSVLAWGGLAAIAVFALVTIDLYGAQKLRGVVRRFGIAAAFIAVILGSVLTLVYSEWFGLIPCGFCWIERVLLYPQVLMLAAALYYNDRGVARYGFILSVAGLIVSLYHHYIQMGGSQFVKCPAAGEGADCAKRFFFEFNFMTFPLLAVILFALLIALYRYIGRTDTEINFSRKED